MATGMGRVGIMMMVMILAVPAAIRANLTRSAPLNDRIQGKAAGI